MRVTPVSSLLAITMLLSACTSGSSADSKTDFDGAWSAVITPTTAASASGPCGDATADMIIVEGAISGEVHTVWGYDLMLSGLVHADGSIEGGMAKGDVNAGSFDGIFNTDDGAKGTWKDAFGCQGTFAMTRA